MSRSPFANRNLATAAIHLSFIVLYTAAAQADQVGWGGNSTHPANASTGVLDAGIIPTTTPSGGLRYSDINNQDYDIVISTSKLNKTGIEEFLNTGQTETQATWWFEGGTRSTTASSIAYSTVEFHFTANVVDDPRAVSGVHFRLEDAESEERFRNFSYFNELGAEVQLSYSNSSVFTYSAGHATEHALDGSFDSSAHYDGGTQTGKWIDVNLSTLGITGFKFEVGRSLSKYGSVQMTALGNLLPFVNASTTATLAPSDKYLGLSAFSPTGKLATLIDGTATKVAPVTMTFANSPEGANQFGLAGSPQSEILTLTGNDGDKFVLQMSYDDTGMEQADEEALFLAWYDPLAMEIKNAVDGNTNLTDEDSVSMGKLGAYNLNTDFHLGTWGVDTVNNTVWAVIDHNSEFAVVPAPEPTSALLALCGALPLLARRRRRSGV